MSGTLNTDKQHHRSIHRYKVLDNFVGDLYRLDGDKDGVACESLS